MGNSKEVPQKLKIELLYDPATTLVGIYVKKLKSVSHTDICIPMFMSIAALVTISKVWKRPKCPSMDEWIKKMWYTYTMEYYLPFKKKAILTFVTNGWICRVLCKVKISQAEKDKYCTVSLICENPFTMYMYIKSSQCTF